MTTQAQGSLLHGGEHHHEPSPRMRRFVVIAGIVLVLLAVAVVVALRVRRTHAEAAQRRELEQERDRGVRVSVTAVKTTEAARDVTLPGDVHGLSEATIYAKVSGYVSEVRVERGQRVRKGDVLVILASPENEKDVATASRDFAIANITAERNKRLEPSGVVSEQDRDNAVAQQGITRSALERARAVFQYTTLKAPFGGVVTARYVDPGALVPAATGGTSGALPLVDVTDVDTLRVFVYVGQDVAPFVHLGDPTTVWQDELPARRMEAKIAHLTGALDPRTRTMQVEVDLDNRPFGMQPGTFAHVQLDITEPKTPEIPDEAIVIREGKTMVCTIVDGKAKYVPVDLGYNDGANVRVVSGLQGGESIGIDVPVEVAEGDAIQAIPQPPAQSP